MRLLFFGNDFCDCKYIIFCVKILCWIICMISFFDVGEVGVFKEWWNFLDIDFK